jgi:hypothetical protein
MGVARPLGELEGIASVEGDRPDRVVVLVPLAVGAHEDERDPGGVRVKARVRGLSQAVEVVEGEGARHPERSFYRAREAAVFASQDERGRPGSSRATYEGGPRPENSGAMTIERSVEAITAPLGITARLHACALDAEAEAACRADEAVVMASTFKVPVLLELCRQAASGRLDLTQRIRVEAGERTTGSTGISAMLDEIELSLRDLAQLMIAVSDNAATDVVLRMVGLEAVNATLAELGLERTRLVGDCRHILDDVARAMGAAETVAMDDHNAIIARVKKLTGGALCDRVIEAVGKQWPLDIAGELSARQVAQYSQVMIPERPRPYDSDPHGSAQMTTPRFVSLTNRTNSCTSGRGPSSASAR